MSYRNILTTFILCLATNLLLAQKPFYNKKESDWEKTQLPDEEVMHTVFLLEEITNRGNTADTLIKILKQQVESTDTNHTYIFLDDRTDLNNSSKPWMEFLKSDKGKIYFIAGSKKYKNEGKKNEALSERNKIEQQLDRSNIFLPENECPGPMEIKLAPDLVLIPLNTQWWLHNDEKKIKGCDFKEESEWFTEIDKVLEENQRKQMIIAGHHPVMSTGNHGGFFSFKQHVFPLTSFHKSLYIPLPILGSIYRLIRTGIGTRDDTNHPRYDKFRRGLVPVLREYNNITYASSHENNLQYFNDREQDYINVNSAGRVKWVGKFRARFTYAQNGFAKLLYYKNGDVWMEIIESGSKRSTGNVVFRKMIHQNPSNIPVPGLITESNDIIDSTISIAPDKTLEGRKIRTIFLGENYREAWATPVNIEVIDLRTEKGGLEILQKGGGMQTKSLQLRNSDKEEFSLRSVNKYPEKLLGEHMKNTLVADVVQDQVSSTHPYAPFILDDLSEAAGVLHNNAKMVYVPNDSVLAEFRGEFANKLALFEKRADGKIEPTEHFMYVKKGISSAKLMDKRFEDNAVRYDDITLLKSRLFDMWINDWDRHEGQWRWGLVECNDSTRAMCDLLNAKTEYYVPIPKDRDQAFAKFQGIFPWIAGRKWAIRKFQNFSDDIRDVPGLNFNARNFDHAFLSRLSREDWEKIAAELESELTDTKIESAVSKFPAEIYKIDGKEFVDKLKSRRNHIDEYAKDYYEYLSKFVDVTGSEKKEIFEIERLADNKTNVKMFATKEHGDKGELVYERTFIKNETKEVRIYGMGGDDVFNLKGNVKKGILVRIIGGDGDDSVNDTSKVAGLTKKTKFYDIKDEKNKYNGSEVGNETSRHEEVNEYKYKSYQYNLVSPLLSVGYNFEDGVLLGGGILIRRHGFRKEPYANKQRLVGNMSVLNQSFNINYSGDFINVYKKWGINIIGNMLAPNSATNFFGLGNNTINIAKLDTFYSLRMDNFSIFPGIKRYIGDHHSIKFGPTLEYIDIKKTPGRFITSEEGLPYLANAQSRTYGGGRIEYSFSHIDDTLITQRGIKYSVAVDSETDVNDPSETSYNIEGQISVFIPVGGRSVLAIRTGGASRIGDFDFWQGNTLGGFNPRQDNGNLRGFARTRFTGRTSAYANFDFRVKLMVVRTYFFPAHIGFLGFYDLGRVWVDGENSNLIHMGYGGGFWFDPFNRTVINTFYSTSKEGGLINVGIGFLF